jgi:membrane-bound ClpP family serine protease
MHVLKRAVFFVFMILHLPLISSEVLLADSSSLENSLKEHIIYNHQGPNTIGYLHLAKDTPISESTYLYVKFALDNFKEIKVPFVVLDIDSPGGEVFAALKISQELKKLDSEHHIPVVAFIDNWALSAGALLAYSCRYIGITSDASMGAAEPVTASGDGKMESASEKINSALRAEFSNTARFYGRDPLIAEAMVDKDVILVQRKGQIIRLENESEVITTGDDADIVISRKGKLLTLDAKQLIDLQVADFSVPYQPLESLTKKEKEENRFPFSKFLISKQPFFQQIPEANLQGFSSSKISFFTFLSHPLVSSLLMMGLIVGIYVEINTPGFGVFGAIALGCLSLILLSSFAAQTIQWLELIILFVGIILLMLEVFVLPGFGVAGVLGIILTLAGLFALMLPQMSNISFSFDKDQWSLGAVELIRRLGWLVGALLISMVLIGLISRFLTKRKGIYKRLVLQGEQDKEQGYVAVLSDKDLPKVGAEGSVFSSLRPSGKVLIGGTLYDAQSDDFFLEKDTKITVLRIEGGKVIVRKQK